MRLLNPVRHKNFNQRIEGHQLYDAGMRLAVVFHGENWFFVSIACLQQTCSPELTSQDAPQGA
jgi:hypothetical protein